MPNSHIGGLAMVEVEQPAEPRPPSHPGRVAAQEVAGGAAAGSEDLDGSAQPVAVLDILVDKLRRCPSTSGTTRLRHSRL